MEGDNGKNAAGVEAGFRRDKCLTDFIELFVDLDADGLPDLQAYDLGYTGISWGGINGTGFSALASLRDLPIDIVKLDRGFLAGLTEDRQTRAILSSVTDVIRTLGLRSVAEGVETTDELDILRELEVDMAQGFVICRPTPDPSTLLWPGTPTETGRRAA